MRTKTTGVSCLWKARNIRTKIKKTAAYKDLVELTKDVVSDCDVEFIKKKIDLTRGNFRRENKKVKSSMKTGSGTDSVYKPKLWYYNLLLFLTEQEEVRESTYFLDPTPVTEDDIEGSDSEETASEVLHFLFVISHHRAPNWSSAKLDVASCICVTTNRNFTKKGWIYLSIHFLQITSIYSF